MDPQTADATTPRRRRPNRRPPTPAPPAVVIITGTGPDPDQDRDTLPTVPLPVPNTETDNAGMDYRIAPPAPQQSTDHDTAPTTTPHHHTTDDATLDDRHHTTDQGTTAELTTAPDPDAPGAARACAAQAVPPASADVPARVVHDDSYDAAPDRQRRSAVDTLWTIARCAERDRDRIDAIRTLIDLQGLRAPIRVDVSESWQGLLDRLSSQYPGIEDADRTLRDLQSVSRRDDAAQRRKGREPGSSNSSTHTT